MDVKQVVLFVGLVLSVSGRRCHTETELPTEAQKLRKRLHLSEVPQLPEPDTSCPLDLFAQQLPSSDQRDRSLSPWTYENVPMKDFFPPYYVRARCRCAGCILFKKGGTVFESADYNSATVNQTQMFLKRERCNETSYSLTPVSISVPVACTCVRPET